MKHLLRTGDKLTLLWFGIMIFALYRYAWDRPPAVALFAAAACSWLYAVVLIALNEMNRQKKSPAAYGRVQSSNNYTN